MSIAKDFLLIPLFLSLIIVLIPAEYETGLHVCIFFAVAYTVLKFIKKYFILKNKLISQREYFINVLSHDLRVSTLAQLRGVEILGKMLSGQEQKELLVNIDESCKYTLDMISMLLNTYRYENGEQILNYEKICLDELLFDCAKQVEKLANAKRVEIICKKISPIHHIEADRTGMSRVLVNLLSAAIVNSEDKSDIILTVSNNGESVKFSLGYKGKFLTEEEFCRMFSNNSIFSTVGHGIRMNFCKKIVEFHGGEINVFKSDKKINSFTFTIPVKKQEHCLPVHINKSIQLSFSDNCK